MRFFSAKRAVTNIDTEDEKKFDRFLKQLALSDRKKYLKEYIKALKSTISKAERKLARRRRQLTKLGRK